MFMAFITAVQYFIVYSITLKVAETLKDIYEPAYEISVHVA